MSLSTIRQRVIACEQCGRLRAHCARVAEVKRAAFRHESYWGRPLPGFGDHQARIMVLGLAPAAHGANRTGRMFTGDRSGDFLMRAMHDAGLANKPASRDARDGLQLRNAYITAAVRCAPPDNRPTPSEIASCAPFLEQELTALRTVRVVVALGKIACDAYWRLLASTGTSPPRPRPRFAHGLVYEPDRGPALVASYHPSQQNTQTGRLTPAMLDDVFASALAVASRR